MLMTEKKYKFWFCTGSQDLYGDECLAHVAKHSQIIVEELNKSGRLPFELVWKPTLITNEVIRKTFNEANQCQRSAQFVGNIGIEPQTFVIQFLFLLMTFLSQLQIVV